MSEGIILSVVSFVGSSSLFCLILIAGLLIWKDKVCGRYPKFPILCDSNTSTSTPSPTNNSNTPQPATQSGPQQNVKLSQYWVAQDGHKYMLDCGDAPPQKPESKPKKGKEVVLNKGTKKYELQGTGIKVDAYMWDACYCEGTCHVGDNTTVNLESEGKNPKFSKTTGKTWGKGTKDNPLTPWTSITADNQFPHGTTLYIKELDGVTLPAGDVHNGCVRVDDSCGDGCVKNQMDFHVGTYDNYLKVRSKLPDKVNVSKQQCTVKQYKV